MSDEVASGKICINCRLDCSTRPRVKDRAGRYVCRDCLKQMKATGQTLPPPPAARASLPAPSKSEQDVMAALVDEAVTRQPDSCPHCGVPSKKGAVLCLHCGYNRETGKTVHTHIERAKRESQPKERRTVQVAISGTVMFFSLCGLLGLLLTGAVMEPTLAPVYILGWLVLGLVAFIYLVVAAFVDGDVAYGIVALVSILLPIVGLANLYYAFVVSERGGLKAVYGAYLLGMLGLIPLAGEFLSLMGAAQ